MVCCVLLEATGHGPPVTFFLDADVAGSLWILTRGVVGASGDAYALKFAAAPSQFCASAALAVLWGLEDLNPTNFCCVDPPPDSPFPITFFDFVPELLNTSSTFRKLDNLVKRVMESGSSRSLSPAVALTPLAVVLGSAISVDFGAPLLLSFSGRFPVISPDGFCTWIGPAIAECLTSAAHASSTEQNFCYRRPADGLELIIGLR
jgi:hypothetical protein